MSTEARERLKESMPKIYGYAPAPTTGTAHRDSNGTRPPRSRTLTSSRSAERLHDTPPYAATDYLDSEAARLPRIRTTILPAGSSEPSSNRQELERREKDLISIREELMKHSIRGPNHDQQRARRTSTLNVSIENNNSWVHSLREPPPGRRSTVSRKQGPHEEISENRRSSRSEDEDKPALTYVDSMSATRNPKHANGRDLFSRDVPPRPAPNVDGRPVKKTNYGDIPAVEEENLRRSNSASKVRVDLTKLSTGDREPSPAQNRHRLPSDSLTKSVTILMPSGEKICIDSTNFDLKPGARPGAARSSSARFVRTSNDGLKLDLKLDGVGPNNSNARSSQRDIGRNEEPAGVARSSSARFVRTSNDGLNLDLKADGAGPNNSKARSSQRDIRRNEEPAVVTGAHRRHASTGGKLKRADEWKTAGPPDAQRTHRRHASTGGNLKHENDMAADFVGRSLRRDGEADSAAGTRQRSISRNKDNLKREDEWKREGPVDTHRTHRRYSSTGGNSKREDDMADFPGRSLRPEGESDAAAGTRQRSISRNKDNLKRENEWKREGPGDTDRTHRRLANTSGNFKHEDGTMADFTSRSLRHECESDAAGGTRRRSISRNKNFKEENASHFSVTRQGSGRNLKPKGAVDYANKYGRQYATGGNLKHENASNSAAGSKDKLDTSQQSCSASQKYRATEDNVGMPLKKVAAASYNGGSLPFDGMVPFPDDIAGLNKFLDDCRSEVEAAVPGRYLTVVLGKENSDLDSMVSTISYAYFLHCKVNQEGQWLVPVINMPQEDFVLNNEAAWLFKVTGVDTSNFIFVDQISLPSYQKCDSLRLVLVDHSKLTLHQENLQDTVVTIIDHHMPQSVYPWVLNVEIEQVGSCCTLIAEKYASEAPKHLAGRGISRLLLGPILLDTANLNAKFARCTTLDERMAALLIHGAGRYGRQGFFRQLRKMTFDMSNLSTTDLLMKELIEWTVGPGKTDRHGCKGMLMSAAMTTLGVPLIEILSRKDIVTDLRHFGREMELDLHLIVTRYFDNFDRYHREMLMVPKDNELVQHIITCFSEHNNGLKLSSLRIDGLPEEMLVYKQSQGTASRTTVREILSVHFTQ